uniref:Poly(A) RNA polymerase mitochondrial-like central palm domain-containing protein n=1 Tax=Romanomermis culicivorax TaxID=13658 RepID=A0A915JD53_ROMCU
MNSNENNACNSMKFNQNYNHNNNNSHHISNSNFVNFKDCRCYCYLIRGELIFQATLAQTLSTFLPPSLLLTGNKFLPAHNTSTPKLKTLSPSSDLQNLSGLIPGADDSEYQASESGYLSENGSMSGVGVPPPVASSAPADVTPNGNNSTTFSANSSSGQSGGGGKLPILDYQSLVNSNNHHNQVVSPNSINSDSKEEKRKNRHAGKERKFQSVGQHFPSFNTFGKPPHRINHFMSNFNRLPSPSSYFRWDKLSRQIWDFFTLNCQQDSLFKRKLELRDILYKIVAPTFPLSGLYIVGSSLNGFGNNTSDMDICLMFTCKDVDQRTEAIQILTVLEESFSRHKLIRSQTLIEAKVPILRIQFNQPFQDITVDLNANNPVGIKNTHLLFYYRDWRVRPLVLMVKEWCRSQGINDASRSTLSSYSLVLMVIHYLQ